MTLEGQQTARADGGSRFTKVPSGHFPTTTQLVGVGEIDNIQIHRYHLCMQK